MNRRFQILIAMALSLSVGLHWGFLQTVAWTGMIVSYTQDGSLSEAIEKTFDGQHPCKLCKIVRAGTDSEKSSERSLPGKKLDPWVAFESIDFILPCPLVHAFHFLPTSSDRTEQPPLPPPLSA